MVVSVSLERVVPRGLRIHVVRAGATAPRSPGIQPLRVSVRGDRKNQRFFVDFQPVAWEDFDALLKKQLARRPPDWPVYLEGDPDMEWRQVAEVIDAVRGQHAEVVLLPSAAKRR